MISPKIIYEDSEVLILDKPSGLITHPKNIDDTQPSVTQWLIEKYPELENIGEPFDASGHDVARAGVVHRLDKDTSGLLVVAKDAESFSYLKKLFQDRKINKYYLAVVHGRPKESKGIIDSPLGRIGIKRTTKIIGKKLIDEKEAKTEYKVLKYFKNYALVELRPRTGRTHQLRVHLNSMGNPIIGDKVYGFKKLKDPIGLNRLFLHAYKLEFTSPSGKSLTLETDLPEDLQNVLNELE